MNLKREFLCRDQNHNTWCTILASFQFLKEWEHKSSRFPSASLSNADDIVARQNFWDCPALNFCRCTETQFFQSPLKLPC